MTKTLSKMHKRVNASKEERDEMRAAEIIRQAGEVPPNKYWDDANTAFVEINHSIDQANALLLNRVQLAMSTPERRALIQDEADVAKNLNLVSKDILNCRQQLDAIQKGHADKTGAVTTAEEIIQVMEINEQYRVTLCLYNDNVMPSVSHILELLGEDKIATEQAMLQQAAQADALESLVPNPANDLTDVNVISDVVVKEITPTAAS